MSKVMIIDDMASIQKMATFTLKNEGLKVKEA